MIFDREELVNHVEPKKKIAMRNVVDKLEIALYSYTLQITDFLDPYEVYLAKSILNRFDELSYTVDGGYPSNERCIIYIYPMGKSVEESEIVIFQMEIPEKITHRDILGSILGLGIDRKKVGDILIDGTTSYIFVKREIGDFIYTSLNKVGRNHVNLREISRDEIKIKPTEYINKSCILSSTRLDTFIAEALNISRGKSQNIIRSEKVKVNFRDENRVGYNLSEGDLVSVRGFGRIIFNSLLGTTKKDKFIVEVLIPK